MKPNLMILAAGMGSRYGGLKQVDSIGPSGEAIIEYSIYDALKAGFGKIIFIIRESIESDFRAKFEAKFKGKFEYEFAFQEFNTGFEKEEEIPERAKPWGTAHAIMAAESVTDAPFAVINADDYYGVEAFQQMADFLKKDCSEKKYGMVGYILNNTLSENGSVSRGVCSVNEQGNLAEVNERTSIAKVNDEIQYQDANGSHFLPDNTIVSMNFWGFHPSLFDYLKVRFKEFVKETANNPKSEFFIPLPVDEMIKKGLMELKVMESNDKWYGVTYQEDKPIVQAAFKNLIEKGVYPNPLW
ncbi:MAG: nucleotidyltransferase [Saprospiraceae bacterium]|nr:nucleotidyltransferase [Saprospiraceae bacterium]